MHPVAAIALVFLSGLAWVGTILTVLVSLSKEGRRRESRRGALKLPPE